MKPITKVIIIFVISAFFLYLDLPKNIPVKFNFYNYSIDKQITRPDFKFQIGNFSVNKSLDLVLGLDLEGGSHLVFEADTSNLSDTDRASALKSVRSVIERRVNLFGVSEPNVQMSSFENKDRIIVELPGVKETKKAVDLIGKTAQLQFAEVGDEESPGIKPTELTGADLKSAEVATSTVDASPIVTINFTEEGGVKFAEITKRNLGKPLAILLDDEIVSAPIVQQEIVGGTAQISGSFTSEEAKNLAIQLNAGALPLTIKLVEERTVGASLGAESVNRSLYAGLFGLMMVLVFMVVIYGKMGLIADISLLIFGILTLSLYKLVPVVVTLPGIAGFLLSVGMAVDSNILIFERFKEEIRIKSFSSALETSFGRAWDSIRDANVATLVTCFILANPFDWSFLHTSGPVRGFAITLALGIGVSLFTGLVVTRNFLRVFVREKS